MRARLALVLLCTLLCQTFAFAEEGAIFKEENFTLSSMITPNIAEINKNFKNSVSDYTKYENLSQIDIDTLLLKKGSKFYVKSLQPMSSDTPQGACRVCCGNKLIFRHSPIKACFYRRSHRKQTTSNNRTEQYLKIRNSKSKSR